MPDRSSAGAPTTEPASEREYAEMDRLDELIYARWYSCLRCFDRGVVSGMGETVPCPRCARVEAGT